MQSWLAAFRRLSFISGFISRSAILASAAIAFVPLNASAALAQPSEAAGEANLQLPDLSSVSFLG